MKRAISILLSMVMLFALCGSVSADLSAEERERIYQEVAAEKAAAEETAGIEMPDLFGIWYDINSKATIEVKEDAAYMNSVTIWNSERTHGLTTYGWHIENGELVEHPVGATEEWLKACGHLFKRIKIVEDDGILQLHYLSGVYVRENDVTSTSVSDVPNRSKVEENSWEITYENPIPLYEDERVSVILTRIYEEEVFGQKPNKCIEFKLKNKLGSPIRLWSMTMYLDGEEMHSVHKQNIKAIYGGKSAIRAFNVEYGNRTPLDSLDELLVGECMLDIEIRSEDGSSIVDEFMISFDYDLTEQQ